MKKFWITLYALFRERLRAAIITRRDARSARARTERGIR